MLKYEFMKWNEIIKLSEVLKLCYIEIIVLSEIIKLHQITNPIPCFTLISFFFRTFLSSNSESIAFCIY